MSRLQHEILGPGVGATAFLVHHAVDNNRAPLPHSEDRDTLA